MDDQYLETTNHVIQPDTGVSGIDQRIAQLSEQEHTGTPLFTPGKLVTVVGPIAQAAVGGDHGIVVGSTGDLDNGSGKVVVALDMPLIGSTNNAVVAPADLEVDVGED